MNTGFPKLFWAYVEPMWAFLGSHAVECRPLIHLLAFSFTRHPRRHLFGWETSETLILCSMCVLD